MAPVTPFHAPIPPPTFLLIPQKSLTYEPLPSPSFALVCLEHTHTQTQHTRTLSDLISLQVNSYIIS